jgi:hypothetical protein
VRGWGGEGGGGGKGGEMTQTLYAHMNKRNFKKRNYLAEAIIEYQVYLRECKTKKQIINQ